MNDDSILVSEIDNSFEFDESDIVVEIARIVLGVNEDGDDVFFNVRIELGLAVDIPLAQSDAEIARIVSDRIKRGMLK